MASALSPLPAPVRLSRRVLEWGLLLAVVLVVMLVFGRQARLVQGQAELAAVKTTLAALRTALVLGHLEAAAANANPSVAKAQRNPFVLLQRLPVNYVGEMSAEQAALAAPGSWLYDPACACVAYLPIDPQSLLGPNGATMIWYRVVAGPGVSQLVPMQAYVWQGQVLD